jgi:Xaa-Pro aminopeptidase
MTAQKKNLLKAEKLALQLFDAIEAKNLIQPGKTEKELNTEVFHLAHELLGTKKHWHKRIVRSGPNTLFPYDENPPDLTMREDDILFFDFGPVLEAWEADIGRTYVIGADPDKLKIKQDIEASWFELKEWFALQDSCTGAQLYQEAVNKAKEKGWEFGGEIAGHIIGEFPHQQLGSAKKDLYVHPENHNDLKQEIFEEKRHWILEVHFVDRAKQIGGFFEQLLA